MLLPNLVKAPETSLARTVTISISAFTGGAKASVFGNGMTRAPALRLPSAEMAVEVKAWMEEPENFRRIKAAFESTSRFAKLQELPVAIAGRHLHPRFKSQTGDAMGMNMISKAVLQAMDVIATEFPEALLTVNREQRNHTLL